MSNYDITVGPARVFICKHAEPHAGPCLPSPFVHGELEVDDSAQLTTLAATVRVLHEQLGEVIELDVCEAVALALANAGVLR
jgi:hypothetical protein